MATSKPPTNGSPSPDRPAWGPPRDRPVASRPSLARTFTPSPSPRRRHPAARARRIASWATVASSAAIVGYMVTANAQQPSSQRVVTPSIQDPTVLQPAVQQPAIVVPANQDDNTPAPVVTQPNVPVATPPVVTKHNRQIFQPLPNSSTHGS